ncbi:hypothetical protein BDB01DRAFT_771746 [Pilobolus umbonatus]|nr:hypothetical protein BDB01DRAFT_771746 [Pilobolus umbonatus]
MNGCNQQNQHRRIECTGLMFPILLFSDIYIYLYYTYIDIHYSLLVSITTIPGGVVVYGNNEFRFYPLYTNSDFIIHINREKQTNTN